MTQQVLNHVPDAQVPKIVADAQTIGWHCTVTSDGPGTSKVVMTPPAEGAHSIATGAAGHLAAAETLSAQASAHAALAAVHLEASARG